MSDYTTREEWEATRREALAAARLKRDDEVYVVPAGTYGVHVFGHEEDATAYARLVGRAAWRERVLDHADARRLIEQEGD